MAPLPLRWTGIHEKLILMDTLHQKIQQVNIGRIITGQSQWEIIKVIELEWRNNKIALRTSASEGATLLKGDPILELGGISYDETRRLANRLGLGKRRRTPAMRQPGVFETFVWYVKYLER